MSRIASDKSKCYNHSKRRMTYLLKDYQQLKKIIGDKPSGDKLREVFVAWKGIPMEDIETNYFDFQVCEKLLFTTRGAKKDLATSP
jgi:hypothetical protein